MSCLPRTKAVTTLVRNVVTPVFPASVNVLTYPLSILLSGKMLAILERPYRAARDLYDLFWLLSRGVQEDAAYLRIGATSERTRGIVRSRRELNAALQEAIEDYADALIRTELGAMLPRKQRRWASEALMERTQELLRLRLASDEGTPSEEATD